MANDPIATEAAIRNQLNIDKDANHVVLIESAAHMDWDWLYPFQALVTGVPDYNSSANSIVTEGLKLIRTIHQPAQYYFSICEMGFFRAVAELPANKDLLKNFNTEIGDRLGIQGGGITSPDNFLPHGEVFIRNYLLGKAWLRDAQINLPQGYCYVPDDFGSDSQLPVAVQAMGFSGVSFERIPEQLGRQLTAADFVWEAADKSSAVAHWLLNGYCQGHKINQGDPLDNLQDYIGKNATCSPTPYIYIPCGCDFFGAIDNLVDIAHRWNKKNYHGQPGDYFVVVATLGQYLTLIGTYTDPAVKHPYTGYKNLQPQSFYPYPYWTGYYGSRPENKILHARAASALLAAESIGKIADILQTSYYMSWAPVQAGRQASIRQGWEALAPSTHHDYITGTAVDNVYTGEQLPLLASAAEIAHGARSVAMDEIAKLVAATPNPGEIPVVVFNPIGVDRGPELVELPARPGIACNSVRDGQALSPVQQAANGSLLFQSSAPSLGYRTVYLTGKTSQTSDPVKVSQSPNGSWFVLSNKQLSIKIERNKVGWNLVSFQSGSTELLPRGEDGNDLVFYRDDGDLYRFGNETFNVFQLISNQGTLSPGDGVVVESGPLRARVRTEVTFQREGAAATYVREYTLVSGESQVRLSCTGSAPFNSDPGASPGYSVMIRFPWSGPGSFGAAKMTSIARGTAFHWDSAAPQAYWNPPLFVATHDFAIPQVSPNNADYPAIYHADIPGWAIDEFGSLIGCVFRNTPADGNLGAWGTDHGVHTHEYAIRIPDMLSPGNLTPLSESRRFQNPQLAVYGNVPTKEPWNPKHPDVQLPSLSFPADFTLARVVSGMAFITAAKAGEFFPQNLVLRLYQPTNSAQRVKIRFDPRVAASGLLFARVVTALEDAIEGKSPLKLVENEVSFTMDHAIATLALSEAP